MADKKKHIDENLAGWLDGSLGNDESHETEKWLESHPDEKEEYENYREIWNLSGQISLPSGKSKEQRWGALQQSISGSQEIPAHRNPIRKMWLFYSSLAAAIIIGIVFFPLLMKNSTVEQTPYAETRTVKLPDQSKAILNSGSTLEYIASDWGKERRIILSGEAFFEVKKSDVPFVVETDFSNTVVLGTTFNVKARGQNVEVSCVTGSVKVLHKNFDEQPVVLQNGWGARVTDSGPPAEPFAIEHDRIMSWQQGGIYFRQTPLQDVFYELERHFDVSITVEPALNDMTFSGYFNRPDLLQVLNTVCTSAGLQHIQHSDSSFTIH